MDPTQIIVGLVGLALLALFAGSLALWVYMGILFRQKEPILPRRFRSDIAPVPMVPVLLILAFLCLGLWDLFVSGEKQEYDPVRIQKIVTISIFEGLIEIIVLALLIFSLSKSWTTWPRLGFRLDNLLKQITEGVLGFWAALLPVFLAILATLPFRSLEETHPFLRLLHDSDNNEIFLLVAVTAILIAPLKEELMFRVVLQSWLVRWLGTTPAICVTAILFAAVHGFPDAIGLIPLAVTLGLVYQRRRSYITVVVIHALFNGFNIGLLLLQKYFIQHSDLLDAVQ